MGKPGANDPTRSPRPAVALPGAGAALGAACIRSEELFRGSQEVVIKHNTREYRLRMTAQGKLILTA